MGKKSRRTRTGASVQTQVDPERDAVMSALSQTQVVPEHKDADKSMPSRMSPRLKMQADPERDAAMNDDEGDEDVPGLPLDEGAPLYDQVAAVLTGSDDAEIALVLGQAPISCALKLALGMQKFSADADAFGLLAETAAEAEPDTLRFLFRKVAGLTSSQVDADIRMVLEPTQAEAILAEQPGWNRRRLLFLGLAAPYLEVDEDEDMQEDEVAAEPAPKAAFAFGGAAAPGAAPSFDFGAPAVPGFAFGGGRDARSGR